MPLEVLESVWPAEVRCAVSLVYEGGLPEHLELVPRDFENLDLAATFYIPPEEAVQHAPSWQALARQGHEIGNASLYGAADRQGGLANWTLDMVGGEFASSDQLLKDLFPFAYRQSFSIPGPEPTCADGSYQDLVAQSFQTAVGCLPGFNSLSALDMNNLRSFPANDRSAENLIPLVEESLERRAWIILKFEGIGSGEYGCDWKTHRELLDFLRSLGNSIVLGSVSSTAALEFASAAN